MDTGQIIKVISFIVILGLFFGYIVSNNIFLKIQDYIGVFNTEFFAKIPSGAVFLITLLVFVIILGFILSFYE